MVITVIWVIFVRNQHTIGFLSEFLPRCFHLKNMWPRGRKLFVYLIWFWVIIRGLIWENIFFCIEKRILVRYESNNQTIFSKESTLKKLVFGKGANHMRYMVHMIWIISVPNIGWATSRVFFICDNWIPFLSVAGTIFIVAAEIELNTIKV